MSQISAATFKVLRDRANNKERMNEISHTDLMLALRNRADREHRELLEAMRRNDRLNARFQSLNDELDRLCNILQPSERETGRDRRQEYPDGQREAACGHGNDSGSMVARETVRATLSSDQLKDWQERHSPVGGCRPRQAIPFDGSYS